MSNSKLMADVMSTVIEVVKYSPKREHMLGDIKENLYYDKQDTEVIDDLEITMAPKLNRLSATRWTVRGNAYKKILLNYDELAIIWQNTLDEGKLDTDVKARIIGVKTQMEDFKIFYGIQLSQRIFSISDNLSQTLQAEKMSALGGLHTAQLTVATYKQMRTDRDADLFFETVTKKVRKHVFVKEPSLPRKRKHPNYKSIVYYMNVEGYESNSEAFHPMTVKEHFRSQYFEALDLAIISTEERFNQPAFTAYMNLESLLLNIIQGESCVDQLFESKTVVN